MRHSDTCCMYLRCCIIGPNSFSFSIFVSKCYFIQLFCVLCCRFFFIVGFSFFSFILKYSLSVCVSVHRSLIFFFVFFSFNFFFALFDFVCLAHRFRSFTFFSVVWLFFRKLNSQLVNDFFS